MPRLPQARRVSDEVLDAIEQWKHRGNPPHFRLTGEPGAGISTALEDIVRESSANGIAALLVQPPELDIDASLHFSAQLATGLRARGSNGELDVIVDPNAPWEDKASAN